MDSNDLVDKYRAELRSKGLEDRFEVLELIEVKESSYFDKTRGKIRKTTTPKFLFKDKTNDTTFNFSWKDFLRLAKDSTHMFRSSLSLEDVWQKKLDLLAPGRFTVLSAKKTNPTRVVARVKDGLFSREFETDMYRVCSILEKDPKKEFKDAKSNKSLVFNGLKATEWADKTGYSLSFVCKVISNHYERPEVIASLLQDPEKINRSHLERVLITLMQDLPVKYDFVVDKQLEGTRYRPDLYIKSKNLVVEADGLYYHSEKRKSKSYHKEKKEAYSQLGIRSLFFREDEITLKLPIVKSIIMNALGLSTKIGARKTTIAPLTGEFFKQNHLMGPGVGKMWGLFHEGKPVAGIRVKWINKEARHLEISRFCTAQGISVPGGFTRLISHVITELNPASIITFVDQRYGDGSYLSSIGWKYVDTHLSFVWTKGHEACHRMKFPGNTGYDHGFAKVWDCGQAKWELNISPVKT